MTDPQVARPKRSVRRLLLDRSFQLRYSGYLVGLLILVGFQTRWAAFLASGEMAMAYFQFHWRFQLGAQFFPGINKGELAVLYCFVFLLVFFRGSGIWSRSRR